MNPRHVLITGAAGAIGAACARALRDRWPEARLALLDREAAAMQALADELGHATVHGHDLRDVAGLAALVEALAPVDGLVNCAGIMRVQHVGSWRWQDASDLLAVDLLAPLRLQDLVVQALLAHAAPGFVVNIASMAGKVPLRGCAYYGAAKAGLAMASEIARAELAARGIRVVTVYPGPVKSALEQGAREAYGGAGWFGGLAPTGEPAALASRIVRALVEGEPRVIYPRVYGMGWVANNLSRWIALSYGPAPVA